ncbi:Periplasmic thiol disulfide interchange protein DsbA [Enhygromyxa salina]|uniref:Periplasmic thiol disulfide interchange protein DsbA n=1 Tax=Enhygromyxa salina TaxID=215803 RepID=A0A0C2DBV2_9BACT|nr:Periplasmic thiol disulfide interchange protein DsbA [Enhygromyxa salina]
MHRLSRFNGAALNRGRKEAVDPRHLGLILGQLLQRGRPQSRAESRAESKLAAKLFCFASTGPPSIEGGK